MKVEMIFVVAGILLVGACKKDAAERVVDPPVVPKAYPTANEGHELHAAEPGTAAVPVAADQRDQPSADLHAKPAAETEDMSEAEITGYHKTCHFILSRMAACAKDPGFMKYQKRWSEKGAPTADAKGFEKRILTWKSEDARSVSCKGWSRIQGTRNHFLATSKLNTLRDDAKLSCEFFGQELDDDGWFPAALSSN